MATFLSFSNVRAVYFDAVGTLIYPFPPVAKVYEQFGRKWNISLARSEIDNRFRAAFKRQDELDRQAGYRTSEERERQRWTEIVRDVFHDQPNSLGPLDELWKHFARPASWRTFGDVAETLAGLKNKGLQIGIASNFDRRLRSVIEEKPELKDCQRLAISSEIGWRKPAREFFSALAAIAALPAEQILLVGDDWENDFLGATACGFPAVLLDRRGTRPENESIHNLTELMLLL